MEIWQNKARPGVSTRPLNSPPLAAPTRASTRLTLQTGPIPHHREVLAFGTRDALIPAHFGFRDALPEQLGFCQHWFARHCRAREDNFGVSLQHGVADRRGVAAVETGNRLLSRTIRIRQAAIG